MAYVYIANTLLPILYLHCLILLIQRFRFFCIAFVIFVHFNSCFFFGMLLEHNVNLDLPPAQRWEFLRPYSQEIRNILTYYLNDFSDNPLMMEGIRNYKADIIREEYIAELSCIASISGFSEDEVLMANLYYDVMKFYFGCTAFGVESNGVVLHARNLDWWTEENRLSKYSMIFNFCENGEVVFKTIGWPGFIGALSGTHPGCFSLTLNAVLSKDKPEIATPITFFLRDVLKQSNSFSHALEHLEKTKIASDCLILLTGVSAQEMAVIERTPNRFATRRGNGQFLVVTNDYKLLENHSEGESVLQSTSCNRFDRSTFLLEQNPPSNNAECMHILQDKNVMMGITVQQMVFNNTTGEILLIRTNS